MLLERVFCLTFLATQFIAIKVNNSLYISSTGPPYNCDSPSNYTFCESFKDCWGLVCVCVTA